MLPYLQKQVTGHAIVSVATFYLKEQFNLKSNFKIIFIVGIKIKYTNFALFNIIQP